MSPVTFSTNAEESKIEISNWIYAQLGSGGVDYMFTTHHGDVIIRKED